MYSDLSKYCAGFHGVLCATLLLLCARSEKPPLIAWFLFAILLFVLSLSGSRSSWLYLIAIAVLAMWLYRSEATKDRKRLMVLAMMLVPGFVIAQLLAQLPWLAAPEPAITATERIFELVSGGSARFQLWGEAWAMFLDSPLLGVGYGQFAWNHFLLSAGAADASLAGLTNHAHNLFLQLIAEFGLVGGALLLAGIVIWIVGLRSERPTLELWWVVCILAIVGIHSLLEFSLAALYSSHIV